MGRALRRAAMRVATSPPGTARAAHSRRPGARPSSRRRSARHACSLSPLSLSLSTPKFRGLSKRARRPLSLLVEQENTSEAHDRESRERENTARRETRHARDSVASVCRVSSCAAVASAQTSSSESRCRCAARTLLVETSAPRALQCPTRCRGWWWRTQRHACCDASPVAYATISATFSARAITRKGSATKAKALSDSLVSLLERCVGAVQAYGDAASVRQLRVLNFLRAGGGRYLIRTPNHVFGGRLQPESLLSTSSRRRRMYPASVFGTFKIH